MLNFSQKGRCIILLDKVMGLRALSIVFYGSLPSILFFLGVLPVKLYNSKDNLSIVIVLPVMIVVSFVFLLIKRRLSEMYISNDYLFLRSSIITITTILISTSICGISGIIQGKYVLGFPSSWDECGAIIESFLLALSALLVSSTFFLTAVSKEISLPGLPTVKTIKKMDEIRDNILLIQKSNIWNGLMDIDINDLIEICKRTEVDLNQIILSKTSKITKLSLQALSEDVHNFIGVLSEINGSVNVHSKELTHKIYFSNANQFSKRESDIRQANSHKIISTNRLKKIRTGS